VLELPQINLARLIIAGPSIFVKVLKILQNILYEEVRDEEIVSYYLGNLNSRKRA
jgi:hypothetical protein